MTVTQRRFLCLFLFLVGQLRSVLPCDSLGCDCCRSNETHVAWREERTALAAMRSERTERSLLQHDSCCVYQSRSEAENDALEYLRENLMPFDRPNMETLGFSNSNSDDADGLSNGIVGPTVSLSLDAKRNFTWTDDLPKSIFEEYVLNFANANEPRTNWRPLLVDTAVYRILQETAPTSASDVVRVLNTHLWKALARSENESIVFVSSQTPLIFDPMSVIAFQFASCTGLAVLFVDALRAAGVASRLAGTPAWMQDRARGNHNWVEVYANGEWYFMEPSPAQGNVDTLERDPCERWFCSSDVFPGTYVYSARLDRQLSDTYYPMAWEWNNTDVPGEDRTEYYTAVCSQC